MAAPDLFEDVLLESSGGERRRRKLTLLGTLAGEALLIASVLAIPLLYLDAVPGYSAKAQTVRVPLTPAPIGLTDAPHDGGASSPAGSPAPQPRQTVHLLPNPSLPYGPARRPSGEDTETIGNSSPTAPWGPNGVPNGTGRDFVGAPTMPAPPPHRAMISRVEEGMILYRVEPVYPALARQIRVQGEVVLRALISKDGRIEALQVVSGHPLLAGAAVNAVSQWRFRPYRLNGSAVEVDAQITVRFLLGHS